MKQGEFPFDPVDPDRKTTVDFNDPASVKTEIITVNTNDTTDPGSLFYGDSVTGEQLKAEGISQAVEHAEQDNGDGWKDKCFELFEQWLAQFPTGHSFLMEDFNLWALNNGLEAPPSFNAFGHLPRRAAGAKLIRKTGITQGRKSRCHASYVCIWQKLKPLDNDPGL